MGAAITLREDFTSQELRRLARRSRDGSRTRRLLALAEIYDGGSRGDAARIGGVGLQTIRYWVLRFNAKGPDGLTDGRAPGQPPKLNDEQRRALAKMIEDGPIPAVHGVVRWRLIDIAQWIFDEFRILIAKQTLSRELRAMGYSKLSARLVVPANITIIALPPKSPELNPMENVWQFMRDNWLSNRIFKSYEDLLMHCCDAWNKLVD